MDIMDVYIIGKHRNVSLAWVHRFHSWSPISAFVVLAGPVPFEDPNQLGSSGFHAGSLPVHPDGQMVQKFYPNSQMFGNLLF